MLPEEELLMVVWVVRDGLVFFENFEGGSIRIRVVDWLMAGWLVCLVAWIWEFQDGVVGWGRWLVAIFVFFIGRVGCRW